MLSGCIEMGHWPEMDYLMSAWTRSQEILLKPL